MRTRSPIILPVAFIALLLTSTSLLAGVAGCGKSERIVGFQDVVRGADSAYGAEGAQAPAPVLVIITDSQALSRFGSEFIPNAQSELSGIDLTQEFVIAALTGSKPTAGYAVEVSGILQGGAEVTVQVELKQPQPGAVLAQVVTSPYDVVRVRRGELDPRGSLTFRMAGPDGQVLAESQADI